MLNRLLASALAAVALLVTGCATIRAQQAEQAGWQAMADQVTAHYHVAPIYVRPVAGLNGQYRCKENVIALGTDATPWLLAHELGHYALGHGCAQTLATEEAANALRLRRCRYGALVSLTQCGQPWTYSLARSDATSRSQLTIGAPRLPTCCDATRRMAFLSTVRVRRRSEHDSRHAHRDTVPPSCSAGDVD